MSVWIVVAGVLVIGGIIVASDVLACRRGPNRPGFTSKDMDALLRQRKDGRNGDS